MRVFLRQGYGMTNVEQQVSESKSSVKLSLGLRCVKGKVSPVHAMKAYRGCRSIASWATNISKQKLLQSYHWH